MRCPPLLLLISDGASEDELASVGSIAGVLLRPSKPPLRKRRSGPGLPQGPQLGRALQQHRPPFQDRERLLESRNLLLAAPFALLVRLHLEGALLLQFTQVLVDGVQLRR